MRLILAVIAAILGLLVLVNAVNGHNLQLLAAGLIAAAIATVVP